MSTPTLSVVIFESLFAYGLMATIAMTTACFIAALVAGLGVLGRRRDAAAAGPNVAAAAVAPAAARPVGPGDELDPAVVAAISAAVHAVVGAHRIVYIGEAHAGERWVGEIRAHQHSSHTPHHER